MNKKFVSKTEKLLKIIDNIVKKRVDEQMKNMRIIIAEELNKQLMNLLLEKNNTRALSIKKPIVSQVVKKSVKKPIKDKFFTKNSTLNDILNKTAETFDRNSFKHGTGGGTGNALVDSTESYEMESIISTPQIKKKSIISEAEPSDFEYEYGGMENNQNQMVDRFKYEENTNSDELFEEEVDIENLPENMQHLTEVFKKDYSAILKASDEKTKEKRKALIR
jgi:hypothetical protein